MKPGINRRLAVTRDKSCCLEMLKDMAPGFVSTTHTGTTVPNVEGGARAVMCPSVQHDDGTRCCGLESKPTVRI